MFSQMFKNKILKEHLFWESNINNINRETIVKTLDLSTKTSAIQTELDIIKIGDQDDLSELQHQEFDNAIKALKPWRKGPYNIFGHHINAEWQCHFKWNRIKPILSIKNKTVLDLGCGNGYFMLKAIDLKPKRVVGFDPSNLFFHQFNFVTRWMSPSLPVEYYMAGIDDLVLTPDLFDTIICMGVLYHRRDPIHALNQIKNALKRGGDLVLETLIIPGGTEKILNPRTSYAMMKNVYAIPTSSQLLKWLTMSGFKDNTVIDITQTSIQEQRITPHSAPVSLENFLDPYDANKTIEGYSAPIRCIVKSTLK